MSTTTDDSKQFSVGTQWKIKDLTSETGKKFNGKTCVIVSTFDVASGRVGVRIKNARNKGRQQLNIKPINLHADQSTTLMEGVKQTVTPQEAEDVEDCPQEAEDVEDCPICTKRYCNSQCQKKQYEQHKKECLRLVKERKKEKENGHNMKDKKKNRKKVKPIQEEQDKEDCPICTDALPKLSSQFTRLTCCGKGLHIKCAKDLMENKSMTLEQKRRCIMCRTKGVDYGSKKEIELLRGWVKKKKAWSMCMLADRYEDGLGVKQSDKKAIELYTMAAKRGDADAQYNLGLYYKQGSHGLLNIIH